MRPRSESPHLEVRRSSAMRPTESFRKQPVFRRLQSMDLPPSTARLCCHKHPHYLRSTVSSGRALFGRSALSALRCFVVRRKDARERVACKVGLDASLGCGGIENDRKFACTPSLLGLSRYDTRAYVNICSMVGVGRVSASKHIRYLSKQISYTIILGGLKLGVRHLTCSSSISHTLEWGSEKP